MDKKETILKMRKMSIEEKIAMLSDKDEAYVRGFIEGTIFWSYQMAQQNGKGNGVGKATAKLKYKKTGKKAKRNIS